ncbi:lysozyme inhibitor LprI family protein [Neisseria montereyensis]|uniref:Lysozyme inhibitor LprI family protein n=1 Tax=Neisseria montereyensis TaxID=2973938 RepID=A0ABT2FEB6_9NEIS|nr:lysozyme inhibitor LprI family protein [Neisseria montereyensis]MCS4534521.1 lysozyme inhibitor LprI family protein [Neisseria montereyensis]
MYKKLLTLSIVAASLSLAACSEDTPQQTTPELACTNPAVAQNIRTNIQEIIKQEAESFARNDSRQFIDADKIIAAATQLEISLDNAAQDTQNGSPICSADLTIKIPNNILAAAETNSPLIYGSDKTIGQLVQERIRGSNLNYNQGAFTQKISYTPEISTDTAAVDYEDNTVTVMAQNISSALLPYGVKSILLIDGKAVKREDALNMDKEAYDDPPPADPEDILENNAASSIFGDETANAVSAPEILSPEPQRNEITFSANELEQAQSNNQAANNEINRVWRSIDQNVQKELLTEQRNWIQSKDNNCRQAAAQADSGLQAEYLRLQCDTRMTRERSQYLRGYTIN